MGHYGVAFNGTLKSPATAFGFVDVATLFGETLEEEKRTGNLTGIAEIM